MLFPLERETDVIDTDDTLSLSLLISFVFGTDEEKGLSRLISRFSSAADIFNALVVFGGFCGVVKEALVFADTQLVLVEVCFSSKFSFDFEADDKVGITVVDKPHSLDAKLALFDDVCFAI